MRFFAGAARLLDGASAGEYAAGQTSLVRREPVGVCAQITPWNHPLMMAVWKIAPAVAAGNTTVVKPAGTTPTSTVMLAELAAWFLPPGVVNVVLGDRDTGRLLTENPIPALVSITDPTRAGVQVARADADGLKLTHLELGGNAPAIVFADTDVESAADGIAEAVFYNSGQDCTAASRILVHADVHDALLAALIRRAEALRLANEQSYGLAASIWTTDHSRALRVTAELDFGAVWINTHGPLTAEMPHGGFKRSGHGKDLSAHGLADYTRVKHVMSAVGSAS